MSVQFSKIVFTNNNGINANLIVEIPNGTPFKRVVVPPNFTQTIGVDEINVQTAKILVSVDSHGDYQDKMAFDFTNSGTPYEIFIEEIEALASIGSIKGKVSVQFNI